MLSNSRVYRKQFPQLENNTKKGTIPYKQRQ